MNGFHDSARDLYGFPAIRPSRGRALRISAARRSINGRLRAPERSSVNLCAHTGPVATFPPLVSVVRARVGTSAAAGRSRSRRFNETYRQ